MKLLGAAQALITNIVTLFIYICMLSFSDESFDLILVAFIGMVYLKITAIGTATVRLQATTLIELKRDILDIMERLSGVINEEGREEVDLMQKKLSEVGPAYIINMLFNWVFWGISILSILYALYRSWL